MISKLFWVITISFEVNKITGVLNFTAVLTASFDKVQASLKFDGENMGNENPPEITPSKNFKSPWAPVVAEPVLGPRRCTKTKTIGNSIINAMFNVSVIKAKPGNEVAVTGIFPAAA